MQPPKKLSPVIVALIVIVLIGVGTAAVVVANQSKKTTDTSSTQTSVADTTASTESTTSDTSVAYKDGTYTEMGRYISPGGAESINVTITLANDIITSATVTGDATGESQQHQNDFIAGYKTLVVGKDIKTVSLSRVAGASLTTNGFNTALKLIKADAQA